MDLSPITYDHALRATPERAFEVYTARIGEWWHPDYTRSAATLETVVIEPRVGGRVYARHRDEGDDDWGTVTAWEPGRRIVHTFTLAQSSGSPSEISVVFTGASGGGCVVRFEHGGWNERNAGDRAKYREWPRILDRFVALAEASAG